MNSENSTAAFGSLSESSAKKDHGWKYVYLLKPPSTNDLVSNFCDKVTKGGIYRAKQHLVGEHQNASMCKKCPAHVHEELPEYMRKKTAIQELDKGPFVDFEDIERHGDDEDEDEIVAIANAKVSHEGSNKVPNASEKPKIKGSMDVYFSQDAEKAVREKMQN